MEGTPAAQGLPGASLLRVGRVCGLHTSASTRTRPSIYHRCTSYGGTACSNRCVTFLWEKHEHKQDRNGGKGKGEEIRGRENRHTVLLHGSAVVWVRSRRIWYCAHPWASMGSTELSEEGCKSGRERDWLVKSESHITWYVLPITWVC